MIARNRTRSRTRSRTRVRARNRSPGGPSCADQAPSACVTLTTQLPVRGQPSIDYRTDAGPAPISYPYPACAGPFTWSLTLDAIGTSALAAAAEEALWQEAFAEVAALTDYTFKQVPPDANAPSATISIEYRSTLASPGEELGHGGITEVTWDGSRWIATASTITVHPERLRVWERSLGSADIRAWVARHELAHDLGLGHSQHQSALMATRYRPGDSPTTFTATDFTELNSRSRASCSG